MGSSDKIIVLVTDRDDSKHGEISVLDDAQKAERLVETLLEAGFEKSRIRVFSGSASEFQVSHRPVVALAAEGEERKARPAAESEGHKAAPEEPAPEEPAAEHPAANAEAAGSDTVENGTEATDEEEAPAAAEAVPVRFSSLFRSA